MKLSEMTTNQGADVILMITPDIETIVNDTELANLIKNRKKTDDENEAIKFSIISVVKIASHLLNSHRETTWNILGALNQKTADEIGKQPFVKTVGQIFNMLNDKELLSFFTLSGESEQNEQ